MNLWLLTWNADGVMKARYEYDPYGNLAGPDTNGDGVFNSADAPGPYASRNPFRFSTKSFDDETGFGYWGYRYYWPKLGRWLSRDPIGELGGVNLYAYIQNTPATAMDPLGQYCVMGDPCGGGVFGADPCPLEPPSREPRTPDRPRIPPMPPDSPPPKPTPPRRSPCKPPKGKTYAGCKNGRCVPILSERDQKKSKPIRECIYVHERVHCRQWADKGLDCRGVPDYCLPDGIQPPPPPGLPAPGPTDPAPPPAGPPGSQPAPRGPRPQEPNKLECPAYEAQLKCLKKVDCHGDPKCEREKVRAIRNVKNNIWWHCPEKRKVYGPTN